MMTSIPRRLPCGPRPHQPAQPSNQADRHHRANSIAHREVAKSEKRPDKNKEKEKIERIAGQVVDATVNCACIGAPPAGVDVLIKAGSKHMVNRL